MQTKSAFSNPISLSKIKSDRLLEDHCLYLKEDIREKNILILKSGIELTHAIIDKLINFGIYEVNVFISYANIPEQNETMN